MEVTLIKETDNEFDLEAIRVELDGLGLVVMWRIVHILCRIKV